MYKTTYTLAEAAQLLLCHKETLRKAILDGTLQAAKLGRSYRVSRADLQKFWSECGGGELFDRNEPATTEEDSAEAQNAEAKTKKPQKPAGPHQLTLPLE